MVWEDSAKHNQHVIVKQKHHWVVLYHENQQAFGCSITTTSWGGVFPTLHYYIPAGQAKVPNSHKTVLSMEKNVPWLWGGKNKELEEASLCTKDGRWAGSRGDANTTSVLLYTFEQGTKPPNTQIGLYDELAGYITVPPNGQSSARGKTFLLKSGIQYFTWSVLAKMWVM